MRRGSIRCSFFISRLDRYIAVKSGIVQMVREMTKGDIVLAPGTMYGSLSKMEKDGLIRFVREEEKRKIYAITDLGREVLHLEMKRIERLYTNMKEMR